MNMVWNFVSSGARCELDKDKICNDIDYFQLLSQLEALKTQIPDDKASTEVRMNLINNFYQIWNNAFYNTPDLINLTIEEF